MSASRITLPGFGEDRSHPSLLRLPDTHELTDTDWTVQRVISDAL